MRNMVDRLRRDARGSALIELAIAAPALLMMLMGMMAFGGYFWMAHGLQQTANDAARSAIAGLTAAERRDIAEDTVDGELGRVGALDPARATASVDDDGQTLIVRLSYDASNSAFMKLPFVPLPSPMIVRSAAIRLGGM